MNKILRALVNAASDGEASAAFILGRIYAEGWGVMCSPKEAAKWYLSSAEQGNQNAFYFVASAYHFGLGVHRNLGKAFAWFRRAADAGDPEGSYMLAMCIYEGLGTKQDRVKGLRLLRQCAKRGSSHAMLYLAHVAMRNQRVRLAHSWAERAARAGEETAILLINHLKESQKIRPKRRLRKQST